MLVFGYGTLRQDYYPESRMRFVGTATMKGELWVIDGGPTYGIWAGVAPGNDTVFGHVFEGPDHMLNALDHRERCRVGNREGSVYYREQVEVTFHEGLGGETTVGDVWVYMMAGKCEPLEQVKSGNWDDRPAWLSAGSGQRIKTTTQCDLCERKIPEVEAPALCARCENTARGHAEVTRAEQEWKKEGSP